MATPKGDGRFPTTVWTLIARLHNPDTAVSTRALDELCAQYHYPLYCLIRSRGITHHDAEDALHDFLAKLLRLEAFDDLAAEKGRLRTFLGKSLDRFLINRHRRERRRGAREVLLEDARFTLDADVERRYAKEPASSKDSPDVVFDRQWCAELLRRVLARLEAACVAKGRPELFTVLRPVLESGGSLRGHDPAALAARLSMTENALRSALVRLLRDFRALLEQEVRETVARREDVKAEIARLMEVMSR